jgi:hypothetical protein
MTRNLKVLNLQQPQAANLAAAQILQRSAMDFGARRGQGSSCRSLGLEWQRSYGFETEKCIAFESLRTLGNSLIAV